MQLSCSHLAASLTPSGSQFSATSTLTGIYRGMQQLVGGASSAATLPTTAGFRSAEKRRRLAMPVITSTREKLSDIGVSPSLCLGPPVRIPEQVGHLFRNEVGR